MSEFFFRTEDIKPEEVSAYFVETSKDREIINSLKARNPIVLEGSRGVGKSFLMRVAEAELLDKFPSERVFPVYESFTKGSLIHTSDPYQFQHWMLARLCSRIIRSLAKKGMLSVMPASLSILAGEKTAPVQIEKTKMECIAEAFEESWKNPGGAVDISGLPSIDAFKDAMEDICSTLSISRFAIFIDEAAHILLPEQQRQFFTLFRDIRSPHVTCNAAVYPGVTSYGETFQPAHDATMLKLDRDILADDYVSNMREIVEKQADSALMTNIAQNGQNFSLLAYASSGNPRVLLKTLARAPKVSSQQVNEVVREYYRTVIWSEHSTLLEKFVGHEDMISWGRRFIEDVVLPELQKKNVQYLANDRNSTCFFWIHKDAPQSVKYALRLLAYTGIVTEHASGIKATRGEIGTRYAINLGCLFALEARPANTAFPIAANLTPKRMSEYGANHPFFQELVASVPNFAESDLSAVLNRQLEKSINVLDITDYQAECLHGLGLDTVGSVLRATETKLQQAYYIGEVRSRRMRNAAIAAVYEYLSG